MMMKLEYYIRVFIIISGIIIPSCLLLEFTKNKDIKLREHNDVSTVLNVTELSEITALFKKEKHALLLFISDWCVTCPELSQSITKASMYNFTHTIINFYRINCYQGNEICSFYNITKYPTMKVFLYHKPKFNETIAIPNGNTLEDILEYIDKIGSKPIIKLSNMKTVNKFSKEHGDVSYLLITSSSKDETNNLLQCYTSIALQSNNRPQYYFAYINEKHYHNHYDMKIPSIVLMGINKELNINRAIITCDSIIGFINENQYPLMKRIDMPYLNKLHHRHKKVIIITINKDAISQVQHIMTLVQNIAVNRRDLIFGYFDINEDKTIMQFFKNIQEESAIVYNFEIGKYYMESYKDDALRINKIIQMLDNDEIKWISGYFLEDFIHNGMGIKLSRNIIIFIVFCILSIIVIVLFFCLCSCINSLDKQFKND